MCAIVVFAVYPKSKTLSNLKYILFMNKLFKQFIA